MTGPGSHTLALRRIAGDDDATTTAPGQIWLSIQAFTQLGMTEGSAEFGADFAFAVEAAGRHCGFAIAG